MKRRDTKRYTGSFFIEIKWKSKGETGEGVAINLSRTGVGICCLIPLEAGSEVTIIFHFEDEQKFKALESVKGVVKWVQKMGPFFTTGVRWADEVKEQDIFLILSQIELAKEFEVV